MVICLERGADLHVAQLMPLPLMSLASVKSRLVFAFLLPAHLGSPGKGPLNGCVCVCVCVSALTRRVVLCRLLTELGKLLQVWSQQYTPTADEEQLQSCAAIDNT